MKYTISGKWEKSGLHFTIRFEDLSNQKQMEIKEALHKAGWTDEQIERGCDQACFEMEVSWE